MTEPALDSRLLLLGPEACCSPPRVCERGVEAGRLGSSGAAPLLRSWDVREAEALDRRVEGGGGVVVADDAGEEPLAIQFCLLGRHLQRWRIRASMRAICNRAGEVEAGRQAGQGRVSVLGRQAGRQGRVSVLGIWTAV